jgi:regulator of protease activity HflC (stomatin/prohibitin superfamily)
MELKDIKVVDQRGNPVIISGVITYRNTSALKACVDVENPRQLIMQQGTTVLKQVASRYPYSANPGQPSLQSECAGISSELVRSLQEKTAVAGTQVLSFELVDLAYAPEIAQAMLVKQQAEALVDARRLIVGAAVDMAQTAVANLEAGGADLSAEAKERITSTLLAVICSHSSTVPTVPVSG